MNIFMGVNVHHHHQARVRVRVQVFLWVQIRIKKELKIHNFYCISQHTRFLSVRTERQRTHCSKFKEEILCSEKKLRSSVIEQHTMKQFDLEILVFTGEIQLQIKTAPVRTQRVSVPTRKTVFISVRKAHACFTYEQYKRDFLHSSHIAEKSRDTYSVVCYKTHSCLPLQSLIIQKILTHVLNIKQNKNTQKIQQNQMSRASVFHYCLTRQVAFFAGHRDFSRTLDRDVRKRLLYTFFCSYKNFVATSRKEKKNFN